MSAPVVIIGAGIAGLSAAITLQQAGHQVRVLEASPHAGGVMRSESVDGYLIEHGPNTVQASGKSLAALIDAVGLRPQVLVSAPAAKDRFIFRDGQMRKLPTNPALLFTSQAMTAGGWWRLMQEPFQPRPATVDPEESVASFMQRRLGPEAVDYLVDPFISGIYAGDPAQLEVASAFPPLVEFERDHGSILRGAIRARKAARKASAGPTPKGLLSFPGGLQTLPVRIAELLGDRLSLATPVTALHREGSHWRIETAGASISAERLIVATPAPVAAHLLRPMDADLADLLLGIPYAPIAGVHLGYPDAAFARPPQGFGVLIPRNQQLQLLGALFLSSVFPRRAPDGHTLLSCFIGGFRNPGAVELADDALLAQVHGDLQRVLGVRETPAWCRIVRWPQAIPQYVPGHGARMAAIQRQVALLGGLHLAGNYVSGISVDASVGSGLQAAQTIH